MSRNTIFEGVDGIKPIETQGRYEVFPNESEADFLKANKIKHKLFKIIHGWPLTAKEMSVAINHDRSSLCPILHQWESEGRLYVVSGTSCSVTGFKAKRYTMNHKAYLDALLNYGLAAPNTSPPSPAEHGQNNTITKKG